MVASSSGRIEASGYPSFDDWIVLTCLPRLIVGAEHLRTTIQGLSGLENVPNYGLVQGIFVGSVAVYVIVLTLIGPENHGSNFEMGETALQAAPSEENINPIPGETEGVRDVEKSSVGSEGGREREEIQYVENGRSAKDSLA